MNENKIIISTLQRSNFSRKTYHRDDFCSNVMESQNSALTLSSIKSNKSELPKSISKGAIQFFDSIEGTLMFLRIVQRYSKLNLTNHFLNMKQKYHVCRLMHVEKMPQWGQILF